MLGIKAEQSWTVRQRSTLEQNVHVDPAGPAHLKGEVLKICSKKSVGREVQDISAAYSIRVSPLEPARKEVLKSPGAVQLIQALHNNPCTVAVHAGIVRHAIAEDGIPARRSDVHPQGNTQRARSERGGAASTCLTTSANEASSI